MRTLFFSLLFCIQNISLLGKDLCDLLKTEVYQFSYNIYLNQWFKKKTSEILISSVLMDEDLCKGKVVFRNESNSVVYFGLDDLEYYEVLNYGEFDKLLIDEEHTSLVYEVKTNEEAYIPFCLCMDSVGKYLMRVKIKSSDYLMYYINIFWEIKR